MKKVIRGPGWFWLDLSTWRVATRMHGPGKAWLFVYRPGVSLSDRGEAGFGVTCCYRHTEGAGPGNWHGQISDDETVSPAMMIGFLGELLEGRASAHAVRDTVEHLTRIACLSRTQAFAQERLSFSDLFARGQVHRGLEGFLNKCSRPFDLAARRHRVLSALVVFLRQSAGSRRPCRLASNPTWFGPFARRPRAGVRRRSRPHPRLPRGRSLPWGR